MKEVVAKGTFLLLVIYASYVKHCRDSMIVQEKELTNEGRKHLHKQVHDKRYYRLTTAGRQAHGVRQVHEVDTYLEKYHNSQNVPTYPLSSPSSRRH